MKIDEKAREAAWGHCETGYERVLVELSIQVYLDAADLVPFTDGAAVRERMSQELELAQVQARQDRKERDETHAQIAALREALANILEAPLKFDPKLREEAAALAIVVRLAEIALTDTAPNPDPEDESV